MNMAVGLVETCSAVGVSLGPALGGVLYQVGRYVDAKWLPILQSDRE